MADPLRHQLQTSLGAAYALEHELGGGGMSRVFVAEETTLGRRVAVKVLSPELAEGISAERFAREVRLAARLQHPNVVPVLSAGATGGGLPYYAMPFIDGASLRERLTAGALPVAEALAVLRDVARALAYAHAQGVVHRDIKPENVLLTGGAAVVADFGIAKAVSSAAAAGATLTQLGVALGTPAYMAPEQAAGDPATDHRADLYAWGLLAWEALAGRHPFAGRRTAIEYIGAHLTQAPEPLGTARPDVPPALAAVVMRCLAKNPDERPADAAEVLRALDAVALTAAVPVALPASREAPALSVAVLPFENVSADPENAYFSDGVAEDVLLALTEDRALRVAARNSAFALRGETDLRVVAERLGVRAVLTGSVRRAGTRVRVSAQLVNALDGFPLWSERYDRELTDIFALQDEIATTIARTLRETLLGRQATPPAPPPEIGVARARAPSNLEAYDLLLRGRFLVSLRSQGMREAVLCLERATELDPDYATAHAGLAQGLVLAALYGEGPPAERMRRARAHAERALALDPSLAGAHVALAEVVHWFDFDAAGALARYDHALRLDPRDCLGHELRGFALMSLGRLDEGLAAMRHAVSLDPLSPGPMQGLLVALTFTRQWQALADEARRAVAAMPYYAEAHRMLGTALAYLGRPAEAVPHYERVLAITGRHWWGLLELARILALLGRTADARALLDEIRARANAEWISPFNVAGVHIALGDADAAFASLERALETRDFRLTWAHVDPVLDPLAADPRFATFVERVGVARQARGGAPGPPPAAPVPNETDRTLAVLPMANTSGDPDNEHFSDGLTDELIGALSAVPSLRVTGRTSSFALKGKGLGVADVARTLGVAHVLEGSVRRSGARMKARVQLVSADGTVAWSEAFDRTVTDVFEVQEEIAQAVVGALRVKLGAGHGPIVRPPTADILAHDLYLKGRAAARGGHPGDLRRAIDYFERAVAQDPSFAAAYAELARAYSYLPIAGDVPSRETAAPAHAAAARALALDEGLASAHHAMAEACYSCDLDVPAAMRHIRRALELEPGNPDTHQFAAIVLMGQRHFRGAEAHAQRALAGDPLHPFAHGTLGWVYLVSGRVAQGLPYLERAVEVAPQFTLVSELLVHAYLALGRHDDALAQARRAVATGSRRERAMVAYAHAARGERTEAHAILEAMQTPEELPSAPPCQLVYAYANLGEPDAAFAWLERAFAQPDPHLNGLAIIPAYDPLRADPRFRAYVARLRHEPPPP